MPADGGKIICNRDGKGDVGSSPGMSTEGVQAGDGGGGGGGGGGVYQNMSGSLRSLQLETKSTCVAMAMAQDRGPDVNAMLSKRWVNKL